MGLNLAEYLRQKKQDDLTLFSPVGTYAENVGTFLAGYIVLVFSWDLLEGAQQGWGRIPVEILDGRLG